jgi:hypothetical protein
VQGKEGTAGAACISYTDCKTSDIVIVNLSLQTVNTGQRICYLSGKRSAQVFIFRNECLWAPGLLLLTFYDFDGWMDGRTLFHIFPGGQNTVRGLKCDEQEG